MMEPQDDYKGDARLIFFRLEKLEEAFKNSERQDAIHDQREDELHEDINQAHTKIRDLQSAGKLATANVKLWIVCAAMGGLSAVAVELLRALLHK